MDGGERKTNLSSLRVGEDQACESAKVLGGLFSVSLELVLADREFDAVEIGLALHPETNRVSEKYLACR